MDAAAERLERTAEVEFDAAVEAVRVGTIIASDRRASDRWRARARSVARPASGGLTGAALESAVMALARTAPEYVVWE